MKKASRRKRIIQSNRPAMHSVVAGIEVVTITATEFAALMDCRRALATIEKGTGFMPVLPSRSPIEHDADVLELLRSNLGRAPLETVLSDCAERFGKNRTPSRSAAYRYWQKLRRRYGARMGGG